MVGTIWSGVPLLVVVSFGGWWVVVGAGCEGGGRWLLENCTVDASIFE